MVSAFIILHIYVYDLMAGRVSALVIGEFLPLQKS
jgi:hypothetical protein